MMFFLRVAFWLGVVLVLLPSGGTKDAPTTPGQSSSLSTGEAVSAASATVDDLRHFCRRHPDACSVGAQAAVVIGQRAQAGAKMVLEFLNDRYGSQATGVGGSKASATKAAGLAAGKASQQTLTP